MTRENARFRLGISRIKRVEYESYQENNLYCDRIVAGFALRDFRRYGSLRPGGRVKLPGRNPLAGLRDRRCWALLTVGFGGV
jgi:hypothetical protein